MSKRSKHPISIIEETLKYAERMGWKVKKTKKGHVHGVVFFARAESEVIVLFQFGLRLAYLKVM